MEHRATAQLAVTGTVNPDIDRTVPVISLASGRIVGLFARLGDAVKKGQLLLRLRSDDISGAFANYQSNVADEVLAKAQLERMELLYAKGAYALNDLQMAKDTETKAKIAVDTAAEHLRLLGSDVDHPTGMVDITAPVSGVITDQEVTNAAGVQSLGTSPFTISDLSTVWIVCDVYENDLANVHVGDPADITLNAYPRPRAEGQGQQYSADPRSHHPHGQGAYRSGQSRHDEGGNVCDGHVPWIDGADGRGCTGLGDPASA